MNNEWKNTYKCRATGNLIKVRNLGFGEKKIRHADGTEEKISVGMLHKNYAFHDSEDKKVKNIARGRKLSAFDKR